MRKLYILGLLAFALYYMSKGSLGIFEGFQNSETATVIKNITESKQTEKILEYYKTTLLENSDTLTLDTIHTTVADLDEDGTEDVIAILDSGMTCTEDGCIASVFMKDASGELRAIPFTERVKSLETIESMTQGMHDLKVDQDDSKRMIWNGTTYVLEQV